ncbi:MAG: proprotein convertase P-domain-containing protein [Myxococcales bacterium]|nr:proprotein convertase P-domain-containing protein [Myxococcales bacterium]MCB9734049.1 proprotein convertase P-domain-containing protein [Deltaproteobacteria bacterium]
MRRTTLFVAAVSLSFLALGAACDDGGAGTTDDAGDNPLLAPAVEPGKADTQYYNPDGIEVEVDLEADIEASAYQIDKAPAVLGQFAMTYFRLKGDLYLESLAEQASNADRVEWYIDGAWVSNRDAGRDAAKKTHFRIRGINAVLLEKAREGVQLGTVFEAPVPRNPFTIMADAGKTCGDDDEHIGLSQSTYWYLWHPDLASCTFPLQKMQITVSKMLPSKVTYPEYDQLVADGKVTMVILFGQIGDGAITDSDPGVRNMKRFATWLTQAKFTEDEGAPVGQRFSRLIGDVTVEVDLYSPRDFSGLSDYSHFGNFQKAISEHEIVAYDGHSMLGASDFWSRPTYPSFYQIFLYGGCLGYEYYVAPILAGKGGWDNLDVLSAVVEVSAPANDYAGPFLAKLIQALDGGGYKVSWKDMLGAIRTRVGDSTFGMSGVRDNCYSPTGSLCVAAPTTGDAGSFSADPALAIPDDAPAGVSSTITVDQDLVVGDLTAELVIHHTYIGDLVVTLEHDGTTVTLWDGAGAGGQEIDQRFDVKGFAGVSAKGDWTLHVVDTAAVDVGTVDHWGFVVTPAE